MIGASNSKDPSSPPQKVKRRSRGWMGFVFILAAVAIVFVSAGPLGLSKAAGDIIYDVFHAPAIRASREQSKIDRCVALLDSVIQRQYRHSDRVGGAMVVSTFGLGLSATVADLMGQHATGRVQRDKQIAALNEAEMRSLLEDYKRALREGTAVPLSKC